MTTDSKQTEIFIVYLYDDYRKHVNVHHLKAFKSRDDAIKFAKKYSSGTEREVENVFIRGKEYDHLFIYQDVDEDSDEYVEYQIGQKQDELCEELGFPSTMCRIRIAIDKVILV